MTLDKHIFYAYIDSLNQPRKKEKKMSKDLNRNSYIAECQKDFEEVQKDNKLLIHYIKDTQNEYNEFEAFLKALLDQKQLNQELFDKILQDYRYQHPAKTGKRIGVIVAAKPDGSDHPLMGWSLCNVRRDTFNKYIGIMKALDRLQHGNPMIDDGTFFIPVTVEYELERFSERVERYFKTVPIIPEVLPEAVETLDTLLERAERGESIEP